ncbi:MAG: hypothetical protein KGI73_00340 [Patescibacteria group bacterium]|nr:hypothetical protein [Patescibacteria group bacterium]
MTPKQWKRLILRTILWIGIIVGCLLVLLLADSTWNMYGKERVAWEAHTNEASALADLQSRQAVLSADVQSLDTSRGVEAEIRERYPLAKPGESVIVITAGQGDASSTSISATSTLWGRFLGLFSWL